MSIRITCIKKSGGYHEDPHEAISSVGWVDEQQGSRGNWSREQIYQWIKSGGQAFVAFGAVRAQVITAETSRGTKFVKTKADNTVRDNLLSLPECP
jgi:hypothetical protein